MLGADKGDEDHQILGQRRVEETVGL
jgi:hypothetical protein